MINRSRRLRKTKVIRDLVKDVRIDSDNLIYPVFIEEGKNTKEEIKSMPGQFRYSIDKLEKEIDDIYNLGIKNLLLFGIPVNKDETGKEAYNPKGVIQEAIRRIKKINNEINIITDICMCEYTSHGHCGIVVNNQVDNDKTLEYLGKIAISHTEAGADILAPSDMMDGRVGFIRNILDKNNFLDMPIMAYSAKYSSSYFGPFRDAAESAPKFGDRKGYQMDFRRKKEALNEVLRDIEEGADIVMVKPALAYLDIIKEISEKVLVPVAAYNVSGEYSMVKAASNNGWINEKDVILENIHAICRAGADIIITYHALDIVRWIKKDHSI
jgi:porphobilinogen synthase